MAQTLEPRFKDFLARYLGAEDLDSGNFSFPAGVSKADYLAYNRTVVVELKTLFSDPQPKINDRIDAHLRETGGIIFGTVATTQLFDDEAESAAFHRRLYYAITRNTEAICRDANKQIGDTKSFLKLDATGVLIILNEDITTLDPGVVGHRVAQFLREKPRGIDFCLLIFESHQMRRLDGIHDPMLCIAGSEQTHRAHRRLKSLMRAWAAFNGQPYIHEESSEPDSINYIPRGRP